MNRRAYLDWLRGVAVLVMVEAHLFDAWVHDSERSEHAYRWAIAIGGFSAPLFLFLAGVAMALANGSRLRKGLPNAEVAARARRRGWQILGLAFLFRLQSFVVSGGPFPETVLKVDILNVIGISMLVAAVLWGAASRLEWRVVSLILAALFAVMATPLIRGASWVSDLPYPFRWYFQAVPGSGAFTLFPWVGFLLLGVAIGLWLDRAQTEADERRTIAIMAVAGLSIAIAGYLATYLPSLYSGTSFWTGSPTLFFVRFGVLLAAIPMAYLWNTRFHGWSPLRDFGVASFFVYWIHVEMVYGVPSIWLHQSLSFEVASLAYIGFTVSLFALVKLKERFLRHSVPPDGGALSSRPSAQMS